LAIEAVFPAAGQPNLFEDIEKNHGFTAHKPRKVYISTWASVSTFVNIEETIDTKVAALKAHKSQIDGWDPDPLLKEWAAERAKGKEMKYAEGFQVITLVSDEDWELCKGDPIVLLNARRKEGEDKQKSDSQGLLKDKAIE
jgi:LmbE family N-acetylglucosaminyl deacetylase